jgi:hypothetical protein
MTANQHLSKNHGSPVAPDVPPIDQHRARPAVQTPEERCQRWFLTASGRQHRVEISGSVDRTLAWYVDGILVATKKSSQDDVQLKPGDGSKGRKSVRDRALLSSDSPDAVAQEQSGAGGIRVRFTGLGRSKRVTWFEGEESVAATVRAMAGAGGIDFDPEPGSPSALRADRIRRHPRRHAALAIAGGVAKVVIPMLIGILGLRLHFDVTWPDLNLPAIPWPDWDLPSIPWPDLHLPHWAAPAWVVWLVDRMRYVAPVVIAGAVACAEIRRQRRQDARKAQVDVEASAASADLRTAPAEMTG